MRPIWLNEFVWLHFVLHEIWFCVLWLTLMRPTLNIRWPGSYMNATHAYLNILCLHFLCFSSEDGEWRNVCFQCYAHVVHVFDVYTHLLASSIESMGLWPNRRVVTLVWFWYEKKNSVWKHIIHALLIEFTFNCCWWYRTLSWNKPCG